MKRNATFPQIGVITSSTQTHARVFIPLWETETDELESCIGWIETGREVVVVFPAGDESNGYVVNALPMLFPQRGTYLGSGKVEIRDWNTIIECELWIGDILPGREVLVTFVNGNLERAIITNVKPGG